MENLGILKNWSKNDLSRVIVQAERGLRKAPSSSDEQVRKTSRMEKPKLIKLAQRAIEEIHRNSAQGGNMNNIEFLQKFIGWKLEVIERSKTTVRAESNKFHNWSEEHKQRVFWSITEACFEIQAI